MGKLFTKRNIGWILTAGLAMMLTFSAIGKLMGNEEVVAFLSSNNTGDWITILGVAEMLSLILFIIPKTMKFGTLLLTAYFGGAIAWHVSHPDPSPEFSGFLVPAVILVLIWIVAWIRGLEIFKF